VERILVIKLSALGDFIQAFGPFAAIRAAHPQAHITLLTTKPYAGLGAKAPWFDAVLIDERPKLWQVGAMLRLRKMLRGGHFQRVYDLQTSSRSSSYFALIGGAKAVKWSGIAAGCSHPHDNPQRDFMHTIDRQAEQLAMAGVTVGDWPDMSWMGDDEKVAALLRDVERCALLVPGGAPHRPEKRWPGWRYGELANILFEQGVTPLIIGTESERDAEQEILKACPQARSLINKTSFDDIAALARRAALAVGNDTGPMHLISLSGCPSLVLFSSASDPKLCGQAGPKVDLMRADGPLDDLSGHRAAKHALDLIGITLD
jgi:ADP-heptose:LPS heptosyltransferase